ncbi:MAG: vWA domain-containing protein [Ferruginibacter sp.]
MTNKILNLFILLLIVLSGCSKNGSGISSSTPGTASVQPGGSQPQAGVITAGEWNDLDHWDFWDSIIVNAEFDTMPSHWSFFDNNRISVNVSDINSLPVADAFVKLKRDGSVIFSTKTDNKGKAELWADLFENNPNVDYSHLSIDVNNGAGTIADVKPFSVAVNNIIISPAAAANNIDLAFVVDATGSMGDELEYLKTELLDVITRAKNENPGYIVSTSSVVYRDNGDEYLTRVSNFTTDNNITINFIKDQSANGGNDTPEAVDAALDKAVNELQWSSNAKERLLFLVLDAPPHNDIASITKVQSAIQKAAEKGIKIIPITASGIEKQTEFLMRFISMSTNGTYVFITDDSGIGNSHLTATVGPFQVEYLNNLMVRLIKKYAE